MSAYVSSCRHHLRQDIYYNSAVSYLFWMFLYAGWLLTIGMTSPHRGYDPWGMPICWQGWRMVGYLPVRKAGRPFENQRLLAWKKDPFEDAVSFHYSGHVGSSPFMFGTASLLEVDGLEGWVKATKSFSLQSVDCLLEQRSHMSCRRVRHVSIAIWRENFWSLRIRSSITLCEVLEAKWYPKSWSSLVRSERGFSRNLTAPDLWENLCDLIHRIILWNHWKPNCKNCIKIVSKLYYWWDPLILFFFGSHRFLHNA